MAKSKVELEKKLFVVFENGVIGEFKIDEDIWDFNALAISQDTGDTGEMLLVTDNENFRSLEGQILTLLDTAIDSAQKLNAAKDLARKIMRAWKDDRVNLAARIIREVEAGAFEKPETPAELKAREEAEAKAAKKGKK